MVISRNTSTKRTKTLSRSLHDLLHMQPADRKRMEIFHDDDDDPDNMVALGLDCDCIVGIAPCL